MVQVKYLNQIKEIEINMIHKRIGYIQEEILNIFNIMIYNIEYTIIIHKNGIIYLGDDNIDTSYTEYFDNILKNHNINIEDIEYFEIVERFRDENGNVIKNNKYIDNYNNFLTKKSEDEYDSYFESLIQRNNNRDIINPLSILSNTMPISILPLIPMRLSTIGLNSVVINQGEEEKNNEEEERNVRIPLTPIENNLINSLMSQLAEEFEVEEAELEENELEEENETNEFIYSSNHFRNENLPNLPTHVSHIFGMFNSPYNNVRYMNGINPIFMNNMNNMNNMNHNLFDFNHSFQMRYQFGNQLRDIFNGTFGSTMNDIKVTLTEEEYKNIETKKYSEYNNDEKCKMCSNEMCIICNDEFKEDDIVKITKCKHVLHDECLKPWLLKESKKCPVCRMELGQGKAHIDDEEEETKENE